MTDALRFAYPPALWGIAAVAVPVLIHLLLRPRPQRLRFPAVALMQGVLSAGRRASRARNLVLLALRAGMLAVAAVLLAGPTCIPRGPAAGAARPVACVIVVDDAVSMQYRPRFDEPATLLELARREAEALLLAARGWPAGSAVAVLAAGQADARTALSSDPDALADALDGALAGPAHARPLGASLEAAGQLLRAAPQPDRCLIVLTDGAASAWRDVAPAVLAGVERLTVRIIRVGAGPRANIGLVAATPPAQVHPATAALPLRVAVRATGVDGRCRIRVRSGAEVLLRAGPFDVPADSVREVLLELPPRPPGPHAATITLEPDDLLAADQERFVAWETVRPPAVWLLTRTGVDADRDVALLMFRNLLAPDVLPAEQQRVALDIVGAEDVASRLAAAGPPAGPGDPRPALVVVAPGVALSAAAVEGLQRAARGGATILLVPDSASAAADWPGLRALLSSAAPVVETLAAVGTLRWETAVEGQGGSAAPPELARCQITRRLRLSAFVAGVVVEARYDDGVPAIVSRPLGRGRLVALTTGPDPAWSDLGVRAAGLLTWLHGLASAGLGAPAAAAQFAAGSAPRAALAALPPAAVVAVAPDGEPGRPSEWVRLSGGRPQRPWPADRPGTWSVRTAVEGPPAARYAVNWPGEEFDLTPITPAAAARLLGTMQVAFETPEGAARPAGDSRGRLLALSEPVELLGVVLLLLFIAELAVGARARGKPKPRGAVQHRGAPRGDTTAST